MSSADETWVPEWEPEERTVSRLTALPTQAPQEQNTDTDLESADVLDSRTSQHQALAEEVMAANTREHRQQAVSAAIPGVDSGILGFEDVTGRAGIATEDVEAAEQARSSDLVRRIISAVVMMSTVVIALYLGGVWVTALIILTMAVGLVEFYAVVRSAGYRPLALLGLLGVVAAGLVSHMSGLGAAGRILVGACGFTLLFYTAIGRRLPVENLSLTLVGMIWMSFLCYGVVIGQAPEGIALLVWVLLLNSVFDTAAYVVGRSFGSRPLSPSLSEHKTVQGLVGGVIGTLIAAAIFSTLPPLSSLTLPQALYLAGVVSVLAPLGDAFESVVKRSMGIKDMSAFIPGHGGILDRIDGLLLVMPGAYYLFVLLQVI